MKYSPNKLLLSAALAILWLTGCTMAKLEARLEANPQCKDVINPKTGALMPCQESDRAFYRSVGLEPAKATAPVAAVVATPASPNASSSAATSPVKTGSASTSMSSAGSPAPAASPLDCKPQLHKKTGGMLPCPSPD